MVLFLANSTVGHVASSQNPNTRSTDNNPLCSGKGSGGSEWEVLGQLCHQRTLKPGQWWRSMSEVVGL